MQDKAELKRLKTERKVLRVTCTFMVPDEQDVEWSKYGINDFILKSPLGLEDFNIYTEWKVRT